MKVSPKVCAMDGCDKPTYRFVDEIPLCREHVEFWTRPGKFDPAKLPATVSATKKR